MSVSRTNQTCINVDSFQLPPDALRSTRQNGQQVVWHPVCRDQNLVTKTCFLSKDMMPKPLPKSMSNKILLIFETIPSQLPNDAGISRQLGDDLWCEVITHLGCEGCNDLANVSKQLDFIFKKMVQEKLTPILLEYPVVDTGSGKLPLSCQLQIIELAVARKKFLEANPIEPRVNGRIEVEGGWQTTYFPLPTYKCLIMRKGLRLSDMVFGAENNGLRLKTPAMGYGQQLEDWESKPIKKTYAAFVSTVMQGEIEPIWEKETIETLESHGIDPLTFFELLSSYAFEDEGELAKTDRYIPLVISATSLTEYRETYCPKFVPGLKCSGNRIEIGFVPVDNTNRYRSRVCMQGKWCLAPKK